MSEAGEKPLKRCKYVHGKYESVAESHTTSDSLSVSNLDLVRDAYVRTDASTSMNQETETVAAVEASPGVEHVPCEERAPIAMAASQPRDAQEIEVELKSDSARSRSDLSSELVMRKPLRLVYR